MPTLALDTSTPGGSVALRSDGALVFARAGDRSQPHGVRLPGDLFAALEEAGLTLQDVTLLAVGLGPGAFTGLRVGLATIEGLAFATSVPVVGVSGLDAHAVAAARAAGDARQIGIAIDAARGEVFAARYVIDRSAPFGVRAVDEACSAPITSVLASWQRDGELPDVWIGSGVALEQSELARAVPVARKVAAPILAPLVAELGEVLAAGGHAVPLHALKPVYVRRPDAELARQRAQASHVR